MKLTIKHYEVRSTHELDSMVEERLLALESRLRVEEAEVALQCHQLHSPAYRASIRLVIPGPDLFVEAADHTVTAAFRRAIRGLHQRLDRRHRDGRRRRASPTIRRPNPVRLGAR